MTPITVNEFGLLFAMLLNVINEFTVSIDSVHIWTGVGFSWLDLMVSLAYLEITFNFLMDITYGD